MQPQVGREAASAPNAAMLKCRGYGLDSSRVPFRRRSSRALPDGIPTEAPASLHPRKLITSGVALRTGRVNRDDSLRGSGS